MLFHPRVLVCVMAFYKRGPLALKNVSSTQSVWFTGGGALLLRLRETFSPTETEIHLQAVHKSELKFMGRPQTLPICSYCRMIGVPPWIVVLRIGCLLFPLLVVESCVLFLIHLGKPASFIILTFLIFDD